MPDPRPRVFISSVMDGYGPFRDAAAEGIRQAGCDPVRAEDFPAAGHSPRNACLDGVQSADALVLLLGERYGFVGPSGVAVTEEEYNEAQRCHKRIMVFLEDVSNREPEQRAFVESVQGYVGGHWRKTFRDRDELTRLVREAVEEADLMAGPDQEGRARARVNAALDRRPPETQRVTWLTTIWATMRDEEAVDPLDLGDAAFQKRVHRLAHDCEPALFAYEQPKTSAVSTSALTIAQGDPANWREVSDLVTVEIHTDGTLLVAQNVIRAESRGGTTDGIFYVYFLAPTVVQDRLERAWTFAGAWWHDRDPYLRHEPLFFNVALHHVGSHRFAEAPRSSGGAITIPGECPRDPLIVFDRPRKVSRADFDNPAGEIDRSLTMMARAFQEWEHGW